MITGFRPIVGQNPVRSHINFIYFIYSHAYVLQLNKVPIMSSYRWFRLW